MGLLGSKSPYSDICVRAWRDPGEMEKGARASKRFEAGEAGSPQVVYFTACNDGTHESSPYRQSRGNCSVIRRLKNLAT